MDRKRAGNNCQGLQLWERSARASSSAVRRASYRQEAERAGGSAGAVRECLCRSAQKGWTHHVCRRRVGSPVQQQARQRQAVAHSSNVEERASVLRWGEASRRQQTGVSLSCSCQQPPLAVPLLSSCATQGVSHSSPVPPGRVCPHPRPGRSGPRAVPPPPLACGACCLSAAPAGRCRATDCSRGRPLRCLAPSSGEGVCRAAASVADRLPLPRLPPNAVCTLTQMPARRAGCPCGPVRWPLDEVASLGVALTPLVPASVRVVSGHVSGAGIQCARTGPLLAGGVGTRSGHLELQACPGIRVMCMLAIFTFVALGACDAS